jgi:hypothetical protein
VKVSESYRLQTKIQLTEDYLDGSDSSDGSRQASVPSKESLDAEITSNKQYLTDISERDPNNVNITTGKNENPSASRVEPSGPPEPSARPDRNDKDESNRLEQLFICPYCP